MTDRTLEHQVHGLSGGELAAVLTVKYSILTVYGIWAAVVELPTFVIATSSSFATGWAATTAILASLALVGIGRTWRTGRFRFEKWTTFFFVVVFLGYSFALVYRALATGNTDATPTALIPLAVVTLPAVRWASLVRRSRKGTPRK